MVNNPPANARALSSIPGSRRPPWIRKWQPTPVFLPGKSYEQRTWQWSLWSLWSHKEPDTAQQLSSKVEHDTDGNVQRTMI